MSLVLGSVAVVIVTPCGGCCLALWLLLLTCDLVLQMKRLIKSVRQKEELGAGERFVAGATAGAISQTAIYPMEVRKTDAPKCENLCAEKPM